MNSPGENLIMSQFNEKFIATSHNLMYGTSNEFFSIASFPAVLFLQV